MIKFFEYNWQVRDNWFEWCEQLSHEELLKDRTGGVGSILFTLFHIVDVEYSWVRGIQGKQDVVFPFNDYQSLEKVLNLSKTLRHEVADFLITDSYEMKNKTVEWDENEYTVDEILHHIVAHEIHHIGQLSVWSRELELVPISASFIGRKFINS